MSKTIESHESSVFARSDCDRTIENEVNVEENNLPESIDPIVHLTVDEIDVLAEVATDIDIPMLDELDAIMDAYESPDSVQAVPNNTIAVVSSLTNAFASPFGEMEAVMSVTTINRCISIGLLINTISVGSRHTWCSGGIANIVRFQSTF